MTARSRTIAGVVLDVGRVGELVGEARDVCDTARGVERAAALELVGRGEEVDVAVVRGEAHERLEDGPVRVGVEVLRSDRVHHAVEAVGVGEHRAEDGALGGLAGRDVQDLCRPGAGASTPVDVPTRRPEGPLPLAVALTPES